MGAFSMAYSSEIFNKKSVTFTATLFALLSHRLDISLIGCSPAEPIYVSIQYTNIKNNLTQFVLHSRNFLNGGLKTLRLRSGQAQKKRGSFLNPFVLPLFLWLRKL